MKKHFAMFAFILLGTSSAFAQAVSFGVKGGVPMIDQTSQGNDESQMYIVGPSVEFRLPAGFALEADGLYQRVGATIYSSQIGAGTGITSVTTSGSDRFRANDWEIPVLGKYYFHRHAAGWQPYIATGWALRVMGVTDNGTVTSTATNVTTATTNSYKSDVGVGAVAALGVRFKTGRMAILPEVRYTRWASDTPWMNRNEATFLLGLSF
jgi:hypothetical protein